MFVGVQEMNSSNRRVLFVCRVMGELTTQLFRGDNNLKFEKGDSTDNCRLIEFGVLPMPTAV